MLEENLRQLQEWLDGREERAAEVVARVAGEQQDHRLLRSAVRRCGCRAGAQGSIHECMGATIVPNPCYASVKLWAEGASFTQP